MDKQYKFAIPKRDQSKVFMKVGLLKAALRRCDSKPVLLMSAKGTLFSVTDVDTPYKGFLDINAYDNDTSTPTVRADKLLSQLERTEASSTLEQGLFSEREIHGWISGGFRHKVVNVQPGLGGKFILLVLSKNEVHPMEAI